MMSTPPLRVLFISADNLSQATTRYRCLHLAESLNQSKGDTASIAASVVSAGDRQITLEHDIVLLHNVGHDRQGAALLRAARQAGSVVLYSTDDLLFDVAGAIQTGVSFPADPAYYRTRRSVVTAQRTMLEASDGAIVSTQYLEQALRAVGFEKPVWVVRNVVDAAMVQAAQRVRQIRQARPAGQRARVTLGYLSGTPTHDHDLNDIAEPLAVLLSEFADANLLLVGGVAVPKVLKRFAHRIAQHPFVPWQDLPSVLAEVDINLAPFDLSRRFNHAKSELKFLEAGLLGIPTVAGLAAGFVEGVCADRDALVVLSRTQWLPALRQLVEKEGERTRLGEAAFQRIQESATTKAICEPLQQILSEAAALKTGQGRRTVTVRRSFSLGELLHRWEGTLAYNVVAFRRRWARALAAAEGKGYHVRICKTEPINRS